MPARRRTFFFPEQAAGMLGAVKRKSRLDNNADVIRAALNAYDVLLEITRAGCEIYVLDENDRKWPFSPYTRFVYPGIPSNDSGAESLDPKEKSPKNFVFSSEAASRLDSIREKSYVQSNADAIRAALSVYNELLQVTSNGDRVFVRDRAGVERAYVPFAPFDVTALSSQKRAASSAPNEESRKPVESRRKQPSPTPA